MLTTDEKNVDLVTTSGTSGSPIMFYLDRNRGAGEWAYVNDAWATQARYRLNDWRLYIRGRGVHEIPGGGDYFVQNTTGEVLLRTQALRPEKLEEHWGLVASRKIRFLHGAPSAIHYLARILESLTPDDPWRLQIMGLLPVSEELTPLQTETFKRVFPNARIANFYGLSERTAFAVMDDRGNFHARPLYGLVEIVRPDGSPAPVGERGRIITTGLRLTGQPFLRYDTGDSAEVTDIDPWGSPVFREIRARRGREGFITADGRTYPSTSLSLHGKGMDAVNRFRFRQERPGHAVLMVEPVPGAGRADLQEFVHTVTERLEGQVELTVDIVEHLEVPPGGKARLIDQQIPGATGTWA